MRRIDVAVLLDTAMVAECDRAALIESALQAASAPMHLRVSDPDSAVQARIEAWQFGSATLVRARMVGYAAVRSAQQILRAPASELQITVPLAGICRWEQGDVRGEFGSEQAFVTDLDQPFEAEWRGSDIIGLQVPLDLLGVTIETCRRAAGELRASPLHTLVATHLALMADTADRVVGAPAATDLGAACVDMVRALLLSAATGNGAATEMPADSLLAQIRDYVRRHLTDPNLTPERIAHAHHISVRYLYKLCARANFSLHEWTIEQRLQHIRRDLIDPNNQHRTIAAIAQQHGFRDPSHLTRRFREAFGTTPREWRESSRHGDTNGHGNRGPTP
ncbi:AraC family transcriptional regulator [Nocardia sp. NPDC127526]|uniref:helix-turn-helix transcriptional regulator n=1 Tax=Nocardia sp. NPDC127526 TaxID=3345393 RepID=UPI00362CFE36